MAEARRPGRERFDWITRAIAAEDRRLKAREI